MERGRFGVASGRWPAASFDSLFEAYCASLETYRSAAGDSFPEAEIRLAIVSRIIAEAERGELDPDRLTAAGLSAVGLLES